LWEALSNFVAGILETLHSYTGSWGISIILFTMFIRLITHPLNKKQMESMQKMQRLQPKMKILQEKYKNDKEALSRETMQLYRDNKVNPVAGCLPLLVQIPIFILLYHVLIKLVSAEGFYATFLGINLGSSVYFTVIEACVTNSVELVNGAIAAFTANTVELAKEAFEPLIDNLLITVGLTKEIIKNYIVINITNPGTDNALYVVMNNAAEVIGSCIANAANTTGLSEKVVKGFIVLKNMPLMDVGMTNVGYAVLNNPAGLLNVGYYLANSILLLAISFLTWFQQKLTSHGNPQMAVMNILMPILLTWICFSLPAGVLLYWGTTSLLGVIQQLLTAKKTQKEMEEKPILYKDKPMGNN